MAGVDERRAICRQVESKQKKREKRERKDHKDKDKDKKAKEEEKTMKECDERWGGKEKKKERRRNKGGETQIKAVVDWQHENSPDWNRQVVFFS